jgi:DNA polymerase-3 subunit epsilon
VTGWADGPFVVLDTETTGTAVEQDRVVTACVGTVGGDGHPELSSWLINPGVGIPAEATAVHGITTEQATAEGRAPEDAIADITGLLGVLWNDGVPLVAMNATFDLTILDRESRRHLGRPLPITGPVLDPLVIDRHADRYRKGSRKLDALCAHYAVNLDGAHDSTQDALAAARIVWRQARRYPELAALDLDTLTEMQAGWHARWEEGRRASTADPEPWRRCRCIHRPRDPELHAALGHLISGPDPYYDRCRSQATAEDGLCAHCRQTACQECPTDRYACCLHPTQERTLCALDEPCIAVPPDAGEVPF